MKLYLVGLSLLVTLHGCLSCSCMFTPLEYRYCSSDFVLTVVVLSDLQNPSRHQGFDDYYNIKVVKEHKAPIDVSFKDEDRVYTASNDALCGVSLEPNKQHLIAGSWSGSRLQLTLCNSITDQSPFSSDVRRLLADPPIC